MALAATEKTFSKKTPEQALQTLAMAEEPNNQPIGRCSMRRPLTALRMMMKGPAKVQIKIDAKIPGQLLIDTRNPAGFRAMT
nr:hypothetical protein [Cohaesibacter marisflavi]